MVSGRTLTVVALVAMLAAQAHAQAQAPVQPEPRAPVEVQPQTPPAPPVETQPQTPPLPVEVQPQAPPLEQDVDGDDDPFSLDVHAFVSQGFMLAVRNNYLAKAKNGSFEFTEVGINFTKQLTDGLRVGLQLFTRDLGPIGNYDATVDWFYIDYKIRDWLGFRAGRIKVPFGLYNEFSDIDAARPYVLLPQAMYPLRDRDFLLAQTGVELYGYLDLKDAGAFDYRVYGGTIWVEDNSPPTSATKIGEINIPYLAGARLMWETPLLGLRAGGSLQLLRFELDAVLDPAVVAAAKMRMLVPEETTGAIEFAADALLAVASIEYAAYDWLLAAEYGRQTSATESSEPGLQPETEVTSERMYAAVAYRITPWLQPGAYYALQFPDVEDRSGRVRQQHDLALSVRFDINEHWLVKLEGHYFNGNAQLQPALNDGKKRELLKRQWGLLLAKTTAYF